MDKDTKIVRSSRALTSPIENELVMFDAEAGKYYGFNEVATAIWNHLDQAKTIEDICHQLTNEFEIKHEDCLREVLDFLPKLVEKGLLEVEK